MSKKFVSHKFGRFAKIGKSLSKATGHLALEKVSTTLQKVSQKKEEVENLHRRIKAAKEIIKSMGELKGALMKLGQMLSITEDLVLPPEITLLFAELQKNAPPMKAKDIDQVFFESFGKKPEDIFHSFNRVPIAAASIGQVHEAWIDEKTKVAVKVQYPRIVEAIKNDFDNLENLKKIITLLYPKVPNIDSYLVELKRSLAEECNYLKEREHVDFFRKAANEYFPQIRIPRTFSEYSSGTVLTLEFMEGEDYVDSKKLSQEKKDNLAQLLYDWHNFSFYKLRRVHSDPQYGNYLFNDNEIIVLDFGSIREFSHEFVGHYVELLKSIEEKNLSQYRKVLIEFGFFFESDPDSLFQEHLDMVSKLYEPYTVKGKQAIPNVNPIELVKGFVDKIDLKGRKSPREEFLLLDRAHLGLYTKIKGWKASIDWVESKEKYWSLYEID